MTDIISRIRIITLCTLSVPVIIVSACGGGGSSTPSGGLSEDPTARGIASAGAPLVSANVEIKDSAGNVYIGTTDAYGKYSIKAKNLTAPVVVRVQKGSDVLVSCSESLDNINVTPFTTQIMSFVFSTDLSALTIDNISVPSPSQFESVDSASAGYIAILGKVCASDEGLKDLLTNFNLFTSYFSANGNGFDMILDLVDITVSNYTGTSMNVSVGGTSLNVNISNINASNFTAISTAMGTAAAAQRQANGKKIIFIVNGSGVQDGIYKMWSDGTGVSLITSTLPVPELKIDLQVMLNGDQYILREEDASNNVVVNRYSSTDGSQNGPIASLAGCVALSPFSPDGNTITAVWADANHENLKIYFVNQSGTKTLLPTGATELLGLGFAWSPDGSSIYFGGGQEDAHGSYSGDIFKLTTTLITNITNSPSILKGYPAISSDGQSIAFLIHDNNTGESNLYIGNLGVSSVTGMKKIAGSSPEPETPIWTPEGKILFIGTDSNHKRDIYSINVDGTGLKKLNAASIPSMVIMMAIEP
jgi:Tol biopolymer transport system component